MEKTTVLNILGVTIMTVSALMFIGIHPAYASTTTITGWLFPDGTHWNNGIGALIFPIVGVGLFAGMGRILELEGSFSVTLILAGLTIGGLMSMLSLNASSTNVLPFALVVIPGADLLLWIWKGEG